MNREKYVFAQIFDLVLHNDFLKFVKKYNGNYKVKHFKYWKQFICMAFGQFTYRESLSDMILCIGGNSKKLFCLSLYPWAKFRRTKAAVKMHTNMDAKTSIPDFIHISDGKMHDVFVLDMITIQDGSFYVMDRGYLDFIRLLYLKRLPGKNSSDKIS